MSAKSYVRFWMFVCFDDQNEIKKKQVPGCTCTAVNVLPVNVVEFDSM
jgi:hypothetical protein